MPLFKEKSSPTRALWRGTPQSRDCEKRNGLFVRAARLVSCRSPSGQAQIRPLTPRKRESAIGVS
jgi:hypothetical protein